METAEYHISRFSYNHRVWHSHNLHSASFHTLIHLLSLLCSATSPRKARRVTNRLARPFLSVLSSVPSKPDASCRPAERVKMHLNPCLPSFPLSLTNTLICLPFSCFALLVPHCCCSAFWIADARSSFCTLHRSALRYVAVTVPLFSAASDRQLGQTGTDIYRIFASYHLNFRHSFHSTSHWPRNTHAASPRRRLVACPSGKRTTHHVFGVQSGGAACSPRLGLGISCVYRTVRR